MSPERGLESLSASDLRISRLEVLVSRPLILALILVASLGVRDASAQSASPTVEVGLDLSASLIPDQGGFHGGPRVVVNFDGRNAVQVTAGLQKLSTWSNFAQKKTDLYRAAYKRLVYAGSPVRVSTLLGGGLERTVIVTPATTFGNPPVTFPSTRGVQVLPAVTGGAAIDFRLGRRAAVVFESSFVLTDTFDGRLSAGLLVPIGSYPPHPGRLEASVPWAELDAGERAWVTTGDGREVNGEVVSRSASTLTLRTIAGAVTFGAADVRAIDTTDPIRNGTLRGLIIGGLGGLVPAIFGSFLVCAFEEECGPADVVLINALFVGMGTGIGATTGALVDSFKEGRVPLYRRGGTASVRLAPIVGRHQLGAGAVIRW